MVLKHARVSFNVQGALKVKAPEQKYNRQTHQNFLRPHKIYLSTLEFCFWGEKNGYQGEFYFFTISKYHSGKKTSKKYSLKIF